MTNEFTDNREYFKQAAPQSVIMCCIEDSPKYEVSDAKLKPEDQ